MIKNLCCSVYSSKILTIACNHMTSRNFPDIDRLKLYHLLPCFVGGTIKKSGGKKIHHKGCRHAAPHPTSSYHVGKHPDKRFPNDMRLLRVHQFGLDQVPQDIGMQSDEEQRVPR